MAKIIQPAISQLVVVFSAIHSYQMSRPRHFGAPNAALNISPNTGSGRGTATKYAPCRTAEVTRLARIVAKSSRWSSFFRGKVLRMLFVSNELGNRSNVLKEKALAPADTGYVQKRRARSLGSAYQSLVS